MQASPLRLKKMSKITSFMIRNSELIRYRIIVSHHIK